MPDRRLVVNHRETSRFPSSGTRVENPSKTSLARRPPQQIARQSSHPRALLRLVVNLRIVRSEHYRATGPGWAGERPRTEYLYSPGDQSDTAIQLWHNDFFPRNRTPAQGVGSDLATPEAIL